MNDENKIFELDDRTLYLLRFRAMQEGIATLPPDSAGIKEHKDLVAYLGKQEEDGQYFDKLSDAIGYEPDKEMKRVAVTRQSAWDKVKPILANVKGTISDSIRSVNIDGKELDNETVMGLLARIFGYNSSSELRLAVIKKGYELPAPEMSVSVEDQDFIAKALGKGSWAEMNGRVNGKCKVSVTTLKRLYGKVKSKSGISPSTKEHIAFFIAETSWVNLINDIEQITKDLESRYFYRGSGSRRLLNRQTKEYPEAIYSSRIKYGDKVTLTYYGGKQMKAEFQGDYTYKILEVDSQHVKVGYSFTAYEMHVDDHLHSNEIFDEKGNRLDMVYDSNLIQKIHLEIAHSHPKKHDWSDLNGQHSQNTGKSSTFADGKNKRRI